MSAATQVHRLRLRGGTLIVTITETPTTVFLAISCAKPARSESDKLRRLMRPLFNASYTGQEPTLMWQQLPLDPNPTTNHD